MLKDFNKKYCILRTKIMNFTRTYLDIASLKDRDEGNELVELNYPKNTCYAGNLFTEDTVNKSLVPVAKKFCSTSNDPIYVGYDSAMDVFLVGFQCEGKNVAVVKLTENSATSDIGYELGDVKLDLIKRYPNIIDIISKTNENKVGGDNDAGVA